MFVYICDACLDNVCGACEESTWKREGREQVGFGGGACVCSHGEHTDHPFEKSVRETSALARVERCVADERA